MVEHHLDMVVVGGSIPLVPTRFGPALQGFFFFVAFDLRNEKIGFKICEHTLEPVGGNNH